MMRGGRKLGMLPRAGYTLVEVMLAVSVLAVGASGFTLMQGASTRAVQGAQEHTVALQFQETWVERVRRDALQWRAPTAVALAATQYLNVRDTWLTPAPVPEVGGVLISPAADASGRDVALGPLARFCVNLRVQSAHLWSPAGVVAVDSIDAVRVDVRVWWSRLSAGQAGTGRTLLNGQGGADCTANLTPTDLLDGRLLKSVTSTLVRWQ
jgi:prepilin-type N-terminal cleavage/methylation domain-containing protein